MARKAGVITIDVNAGTAKFLVDMDKANAKVREFGHTGVGEHKAVSAAMKTLEGNFTSNKRAADAFIATVLGGGPVLQAAFPVIGAIAFAGILGEIGNKVHEFFKEMREAPEKVSAAFREMNAPLRTANDELQVTNDRLANDIAKLEGRRQNTLKLALDEARVSADKLADSLEKDITNLAKLLTEEKVGWLARQFGKAGTGDIKELIGGESGRGGLVGAAATLLDQYNEKLNEATSLKEKDAAKTEYQTRLLRLYGATLETVEAKLKEAPKLSITGTIATGAPVLEDDRNRREQLQGLARSLRAQMRLVTLEGARESLQERKGELEAGANNAKLDQPFSDRIKAIDAEMDGLRAKLEAVGQPEAAQGILKGFGEARKAIAEVNKQLEAISPHLKLSDQQMGEISKALVIDKPGLERTIEWAAKMDAAKQSLQGQVAAQRLLTAAIGLGFEAERRAAIESQVVGKIGLRDYADPAKAADLAKLRGEIAADYDAKRAHSSATAVDAMGDEIVLQNKLIAAQSMGEEEIRRITVAEIWRAGVAKGLTREQIAAQATLFYQRQLLTDAAEAARLNAETSATEKLTAAQIGGAEAIRKQANENRFAELERQGHGQSVPVARELQEAIHQGEITAAVARRVTMYADEAQALQQERDRLLEIIGAHRATVSQARVLRELQQDRLRLWVQEQLAIGTARAGVRAFFAEMQVGAKRTGNIIYETLTSAVDRVSDELSKLLTGQQTNFGKMVQELAQEAVRSSIKAGIQKGLGELGKLFGIRPPEGKPDGTAAKPYHVIVDNAGGQKAGGAGLQDVGAAPSSAIPAIGGLLKGAAKGVLGVLGKIFGGGGGEAVTSSISYMASGGPVSAAQSYIVGEDGPELLTRTSGYITGNAELRRSLGGGGGHTFTTVVDARGAELGVERRVHRAIEAAHASAVATSVRAADERVKRVPARTGS